MHDMIDGYQQSRRTLRALRTLNTDPAERNVIGGMISDCEYALEWIRTGRRPGSRRGIERRAAYQRIRPTDPLALQSILSRNAAGSPVQASTISDEDRQRIEHVLSRLTVRERECYEMAIGQGMSYSEIAELTGVTKASVQWFVDSARKKIQDWMFRGDLLDWM